MARPERLQQESLRLRRRAQHQAIMSALKHKPEYIPEIFDQLENMMRGAGLQMLGADGQVVTPGTVAEVEEVKTWGISPAKFYVKAEDAEDDGKTAASSSNGDVGQAAIEVQAGLRLDECSVKQLQDCLQAMERVVFAPAALKGLRCGGQRVVPKLAVLERIELGGSTNVDSTTPELWQGFVDLCVQANEAKGRRGISLPLPPSWNDDGVCMVALAAEGAIKVRRCDGEGRDLPDWVVQQFDQAKIHIVENYSERRAALGVHGGVLDLSLQVLFADVATKRPVASSSSSSSKAPPLKARRMEPPSGRRLPKASAKVERDEKDEGDGEEAAHAQGDAPPVVPPPDDAAGPEEDAAPDLAPMASGMTVKRFEPPSP